jgi:uncharacterized Zn finger protein
MPATPLTPQKLRAFPYARQAGSYVHQRGRAYYRGGRVEDVDRLDDCHAVCQVRGDSGDYEVAIRADAGRNGLAFECDCPHADAGNFCKHMVAAGLELADHLEDVDEDDDRIEPAASHGAFSPGG